MKTEEQKKHDTVEMLTVAQISLRRSTQRLRAVREGRYSFVAADRAEKEGGK